MMKARVVLALMWLACAAEPSCSQQQTPVLSVVTYNIRYASPRDGLDVWSNRVESVAAFISRHDVAGLQEVTLAQLNDLRKRLPDFDWYGVGRDDGRSGGEHAVIFYRRGRLESLDQGTFWLSDKPEKAGSKGWDAALPRTCTWIVLRDRTADKTVWVANTHFDHRGANARSESARLIRRVADQKAGSLPVIVMGDFNCVPDSEPYRAITESGQAGKALTDARRVTVSAPAGPSSTWNGFREIVAERIIDHVFVRGSIEVSSLETLDPRTDSGRFASDHLPVRISVRFLSSQRTQAE